MRMRSPSARAASASTRRLIARAFPMAARDCLKETTGGEFRVYRASIIKASIRYIDLL